jgi:chitinase
LFQAGKALAKESPWSGLRPDEMLNRGFARYWDSAASAPYLYNAQEHVFVSYDDPQSLAIKGRYVRAHRLGGIMFWEYFNDPSGKLLDAVNLSLHGRAPQQRRTIEGAGNAALDSSKR